PSHSQAYEAAEAVQAHLSERREPLWLIIGGSTAEAVGARLDEVELMLQQAVSNPWIGGFKLPTPLWPRPEVQAGNRAMARQLVKEWPVLQATALTNGFTAQALGLTESILNTLRAVAESAGVFWPNNPMSRWIFEKFTAHSSTNYLALGMVEGHTEPK